LSASAAESNRRRALAVRRYLIEKGILTGRMDVRALGNRIPDGPPDRVDIVLVQR
jgi:outer membrane protein OmpA-like peptidoglycan-associated protein